MKPLKLLVLVLLSVFACGQPSAPSDAGTQDVASIPEASGPSQDDLPASRKPRPQNFTPASPDTRNHDEIRIAACSGVPDADHPDGWRCAGKRPLTFKAGSSTPIILASWTVPNWFVNKTTGSDSNDCITALTACKTKQEIWVHRLGCGGTPDVCPRFQQLTTLEQDVSDTDNTDPLYAHVGLEKGASFVIQGGLGASTAAIFTLHTAKNTGVGTNALLSGSFSAGAPAVAKKIQNTTALKSSNAWVYDTAGGANWNLTQPLAPVTPPSIPLSPTEINSWASLDTVNVLTPIAINVVSVSAVLTDANGAFTNNLFLYNISVFDPEGPDSDVIDIGQNVIGLEVDFQRAVSFNGLGGFANIPGRLCTNCFFEGGMVAFGGGFLGATIPASVGDPTLLGGATPAASVFNGPPLFGFDFIWKGNGSFDNGFATNSNVFLDGNMTVFGGTVIIAGGSSVLYGSGTNTINMMGSSHLDNATGNNFQSTFTAPGLVTGIKLNGGTSVSCHTNADPDVFHTATTTPAHLDAACGAGTGLGSNGFQIGGASVANF